MFISVSAIEFLNSWNFLFLRVIKVPFVVLIKATFGKPLGVGLVASREGWNLQPHLLVLTPALGKEEG